MIAPSDKELLDWYLEVMDSEQAPDGRFGLGWPRTKTRREILKRMKQKPTTITKAEDWIKVEDGLPELIGSYLIWTNSDEGNEIEWAFYTSKGKWCSTTGYFIEGDVTHWMPLPEGPIPEPEGE